MLTPETAVVSAPVEISLEGGTGRVTASRSGTDIVVDVMLTAEMELGITLASEGGPVQFETMRSATGSITEVTTQQGWVLVRGSGPGDLSFSVKAFDADSPLRLRVSRDGMPVDEAWIAPSRNGLEP
jgi:hypothetical protein